MPVHPEGVRNGRLTLGLAREPQFHSLGRLPAMEDSYGGRRDAGDPAHRRTRGVLGYCIANDVK